MKNRILTLFLTAATAFSLLTAANAAETPASSRNINAQDYATYGATVKSYLYENGQGGVTRVEYTGGSVVVEDYDSAYNLTDSRTIQPELPIWGGFFAGKDANFLIFGQDNNGESQSAEVIRVVKYDKNWNRLGQTSIQGAYTKIPFDAGSLRCAEEGGYLYIHCARTMHRNVMTMYGMMDTLDNHQANLTLEIRESDMTLVDSYDQVWNLDFGYVSHSFNQFILIDQDKNIVTLDHADSDSEAGGRANYGYARPVKSRGVDLIRYEEKAGQDHFQGKNANQQHQWTEFSLVQSFGGSSGNNVTGGSVGGFAETSSGYVSAYNYDGSGSGRGDRSVYLGYTGKDDLWSVSSKVSTSGGTTPLLAPTGLSGGYILWNGKSGSTANDTLYYASYDAGGTTGQVKTAQAPLSDCQPIAHGGKAVWYVTNNSAPTFYGLDASGVTILGGGSGTGQTPSTPGTTSMPGTTSTPSTPSTPSKPGASSGAYVPPSLEAEGRVWVLGETYGGDPSHDHYFTYDNSDHRTVCDDCSLGSAALYVCRTCGAEWVSGIMSPREHRYTLTSTRQPTADKPGERVYTCSYCGASYSETFDGGGTGASTTPDTPSAKSPEVVLSPQKLTVDGRSVNCEKYNIDGSNYFKLRDLAYVLKDTGSRFGVGYDEAAFTVTITAGAAYAPNGTEMTMGTDNSATAQPSRQTIVIDGVTRGDLSVYNIGGSNFFKLRELGDVLGFAVEYDEASNTAMIRSSAGKS